MEMGPSKSFQTDNSITARKSNDPCHSTAIKTKYHGRGRSKAFWALVAIVVVLIVIGVVVGVLLRPPAVHLICVMMESIENEQNRTSDKLIEWVRKDMTDNQRSCESYPVQRYVMAVLYFAMGVDVVLGESSMDFAANECDWKPHVQCDHRNHVTKINIHRQNLHGFIPSEIGLLSNLVSLRLFDNNLTGTIPTDIGKLSALKGFDVGDNRLVGTIPAQIGHLVKLEHIFLFENGLTGTIPTQIGNLLRLTELRMGYNQLIGLLPTEINHLTRLEFLELQDNRLIGTFPINTAKLYLLCYLDLRNNMFTGSVPLIPGCLTAWGELLLDDNNFDSNPNAYD